MSENPLQSRRIVVTRAREQSHALSRRLTALGATVIEIPAIRIEELDSPRLERAIASIERYYLLVFTSARAVHIFCRRLGEHPGRASSIGRIPIAVVGSATARALSEYGLHPSIVPEEFLAEGLLAAIDNSGLELGGKKILIPRAKRARAVLTRELAARGAVIDDIPIYETLPEPFSRNASLLEQLDPVPDVITFTSSSTVTFFADGMPPDMLRDLTARSIAACIGPVAAETARAAGFTVGIVPERFTVPGLVDAIVRYYLSR